MIFFLPEQLVVRQSEQWTSIFRAAFRIIFKLVVETGPASVSDGPAVYLI
jgi:hypothetical protein